MSGSRTSLMKWFTAIFLVSQPEHGINAVALSRIIHVTYKTAWLILHKIRHTCSMFDQKSPLSGVVQVNSRKIRKTIQSLLPKSPSGALLSCRSLT